MTTHLAYLNTSSFLDDCYDRGVIEMLARSFSLFFLLEYQIQILNNFLLIVLYIDFMSTSYYLCFSLTFFQHSSVLFISCIQNCCSVVRYLFVYHTIDTKRNQKRQNNGRNNDTFHHCQGHVWKTSSLPWIN